MIEQLIPRGSTYAAHIDHVIALIAGATGFWFFATVIMFAWLMWRFRARPGHRSQYITGDEKHLKRWVSWPHIAIILFDVAIIVAAVLVWVEVKQTLPEKEGMQTVRIIGQQWAWTFVHPGPDGELDTTDDIKTVDELHLQKDRLYHFELSSKDVLHSLSVPIFRLKQDAVPGRVIKGWFEPTILGEYSIQCAEMCGIGHGIMGARIHIESPADHDKWIRRNAKIAPVAAVLE